MREPLVDLALAAIPKLTEAVAVLLLLGIGDPLSDEQYEFLELHAPPRTGRNRLATGSRERLSEAWGACLMLAQSFKSAVDLGITEPQRDALMKTLVLLETGKLTHARSHPIESCDFTRKYSGNFNMQLWAAKHECGTVCCIGGTAELVGDTSFGAWPVENNRPLIDLFSPNRRARERWSDITPEQAATALRSYLTTGDAKWHEAVA